MPINGRISWNSVLQWLAPILLALLVSVGSIYVYGFRASMTLERQIQISEALKEALKEKTEQDRALYFPIAKGEKIESQIETMDRRLQRMEDKQDRMLELLRSP